MIFVQWQEVIGLKEPPKWQTRRPAKSGDQQYTWCTPILKDGVITGHRITEVVEINKAGKHSLKWAVGKTYAVQPGRGKKAVGRTPPLRAIRRERLGDISYEDVVAEGCDLTTGVFLRDGTPHIDHKAKYAQLWDRIHGKGAWERMKDDDVWVLEWPAIRNRRSK